MPAPVDHAAPGMNAAVSLADHGPAAAVTSRFGLFGHLDTWEKTAAVVRTLRGELGRPISVQDVREIVPFLPPRTVCRVTVSSKSGLSRASTASRSRRSSTTRGSAAIGSRPELPLADREETAVDSPRKPIYEQGTHEKRMSKPADLVQGTLDLLLLKILALEPLHGWAISLRLRSLSRSEERRVGKEC